MTVETAIQVNVLCNVFQSKIRSTVEPLYLEIGYLKLPTISNSNILFQSLAISYLKPLISRTTGIFCFPLEFEIAVKTVNVVDLINTYFYY